MLHARDFLVNNFTRDISLADLAHVADLSEYHLNRTFRRGICAAVKYQTQMRVARLRMLLAASESPAQAAAPVGFYDQSHLNRGFKRLVGVTAGLYTQEMYRESHVDSSDVLGEPLPSSVELGWEHILVEQMSLPPGELYVAPPERYGLCMSVALTANSNMEWTHQGKKITHRFKRGQLHLLPTGTTGRWYSIASNVEMLHLELTHSFLQQTAKEALGFNPARVQFSERAIANDVQVEYIGLALLAELQEGGKNGRIYSQSLARTLAIHLLQRYAISTESTILEQPVPEHELGPVLDYIDLHLASEITLKTLAAQSNLSTSHFRALFAQAVGLSPRQYILNQRIRRAKELLHQTDLPIAHVASAVGFYDQSHLTRHMRQLLDTTPGALRHQQNVQNLR